MMKISALALVAFLLSSPVLAQAPPVKVMVLGTAHFSNPGADMHNTTFDDVLAPKRQAEIVAVVEGLAKFAPTIVATEWPADIVAERYAKYLAGDLPENRNEVVQIGFRLGKTAKLDRVIGADAEGEWLYAAVETYAKANGQAAVLEEISRAGAAQTKQQEALLANGTISALLRGQNTPEAVADSNRVYAAMLRVGGDDDQPGAELVGAWRTRNLRTCAKLIQAARPGDRMVVIFGTGHAYLLRQCISETPGFDLVEPNDYLPR